MSDVKAPGDKVKIIEKIKTSSNILVALNNNPSVDELCASLALTLLLNKMDKHATAIVSGDIPNAIQFLEPNRTFEKSVDSLRDFIIALNKDKADHLRYKIDGDFVKVFITPYRTTISEKDLEFSQGDYNVDLVVALNVNNADDLDKALAAHGRILHDADVVDISVDATGQLGSLKWHGAGVSSISEMITVLSSGLRDANTRESFVDKSIATALMTGIVAATDRFSNDKTTPGAMAISSKLMTHGADQQLIVKNLDKLSNPSDDTSSDDFTDDFDFSSDESSSDEPTPPENKSKRGDRVNFSIERDKSGKPKKNLDPEPFLAAREANPDKDSFDIAAQVVAEARQAEATDLAEQLIDTIAEDSSGEEDSTSDDFDIIPEPPSTDDILADLSAESDALAQELAESPDPITDSVDLEIPQTQPQTEVDQTPPSQEMVESIFEAPVQTAPVELPPAPAEAPVETPATLPPLPEVPSAPEVFPTEPSAPILPPAETSPAPEFAAPPADLTTQTDSEFSLPPVTIPPLPTDMIAPAPDNQPTPAADFNAALPPAPDFPPPATPATVYPSGAVPDPWHQPTAMAQPDPAAAASAMPVFDSHNIQQPDFFGSEPSIPVMPPAPAVPDMSSFDGTTLPMPPSELPSFDTLPASPAPPAPQPNYAPALPAASPDPSQFRIPGA